MKVTGLGGVPSSGVSAVVVNLTVTGSTSGGFITGYADGAAEPGTSNLNFVKGQTVPNLAVLPVGSDGKIRLSNGSGGTVQLIADISGYYLAGAPVAGGFGSVAPFRVLDTRSGVGAPRAAVAANGSVAVKVTGLGGVPSSGVSAVVVNLTVTGSTSGGFITGYADGAAEPGTSNLNFVKGQTVPNLAVLPVGSDGKIRLSNGSGGTVQLIADISGYYLAGAPVAGGFVSVAPFRVLDTRSGVGAPRAAVAANGSVAVKVTGLGGVPSSGVSAVVVNLTVTGSTSGGFITGYADGAAEPGTSNLNFVKGQTVPNLAVLPVGSDGKIRLSNGSGGTVQLIADMSGYYLGTPTPVVTGLSVHSGLVTGGGTVTITGTEFTNITAVSFDDQPATSYTVVNATTITAVVPPNAAHIVHVSVTAAGGTSAAGSASSFTYTTPADTFQTTLQASTGTFVQPAGSVLSVNRNDNTLTPDATTWTINVAAGTTSPAVGDRYLLDPGSTVYPSGVFGTVTAVLPFNGANVITVTATALDDGIQNASTDFTGPIGDPAGATPASVGPTNIGPRGATKNGAPADTPTFTTTVGFPSISASELTCDKPSASLQGSVSFQLVNVKTHVEADAGSLFTSPFVDVWVSYETKITYSLSAQIATTCKVTPLWQNLHKKVFLIGTSPYTISIAPNFSATLSAAGTISDTEHSYHMSGFISNPDGSIKRLDGKSADPSDVELSGQLQLEVFAGVDIQLGVLDRLGVGLTAGIGATFTAQAATGNPSTVCFSANPFLRIALYAYLDVWVKKWTLQAFQTDLDLPGVQRCLPSPKAPPTPQASPVITTTSLPAGIVGVPYSKHLATADNRSGTWTLTGGKLPPGLTLTSAGGLVGTPGVAGSYKPVIRFIDTNSRYATTTVNLLVAGDARSTPGIAYAWGDNQYGQLGNGTTGNSSVPVQIKGLTGVTAIANAATSSPGDRYALRSDGTVYAWGYNGSGELGDGTNTNSSTPVQVSGLTGVTAIASGSGTGYALRGDGTVYAWGENDFGSLGDGSATSNSSTPVRASGLTGVVAIAGTYRGAYALLGDGTVYAWGSNDGGRLGNSSIIDGSSTPVRVAGLTGITAIAGGFGTGYALRSDGTVYAWGGNEAGELGNGATVVTSSTPVEVSNLTGVTAIAGTYQNGYALRSDGTVYAWGYNGEGELGDGTTTNSSTPVQVSDLDAVTAIAGGGGGYALRNDGTVFAWGSNFRGALGDGTTADSSSSPVLVSGLTHITRIAGGNGGSALRPVLGE